MPIAMIPRDHISAFGPYSVRVTTSGAIQYGLPTTSSALYVQDSQPVHRDQNQLSLGK